MSRVTNIPPPLSTSRPITVENLIDRSLGAKKLAVCSVLINGIYKPIKPQNKLSVGRKVYNIRRAIEYHSKKDHRDDIIKIYYTRLLAQYSDGQSAVNRAEDIINDERRFYSTTLFSTLLLDVVELQAHLNLIHCINDFQSTNHPENLQLRVRKFPHSISEVLELLPFPRDLLSDKILELENTRFRIYTNIVENLSDLYCLERGVNLEDINVEDKSVTYRKIPNGHIIPFEYGLLPYKIRSKKTRSEVAEYVIKYDSTKLLTTYNKISPWTSSIPEQIIKQLTCVERIKLAFAGVRIELNSCNDNLCICKSAIFRRMQLTGGCTDLDYQKLITTYRFCAYSICLEQIGRYIKLDKPAKSLTFSHRVIPWHTLNRGSII